MVQYFQVRAAQLKDASAISACVKEAYEPYVERIGKKPGPMLDDYTEVIRNHDVYVVEGENEILCGVLVLITQNDALLLDNIAVANAARGKGVGKQLLCFAEEEAQRRGWPFIELYTHELMHENIALYQKIGYVEMDRRVEKGYSRVYMRKFFKHHQ